METNGNDKITFHYIKNENFRTGFASGVIGGVTVKGLINLNFYIDRVPIPEYASHEVDKKTGQVLMPPFDVKTKQGSIREVQSGVEIDLATAKELQKWLTTHIEALEKGINKL